MNEYPGIKIRSHRGTLSESMKTVEGIEPTLAAVREYLSLHEYGLGEIRVNPVGHDTRNGWDTHVVTMDGCAVAFTDGPLMDMSEDWLTVDLRWRAKCIRCGATSEQELTAKMAIGQPVPGPLPWDCGNCGHPFAEEQVVEVKRRAGDVP